MKRHLVALVVAAGAIAAVPVTINQVGGDGRNSLGPLNAQASAGTAGASTPGAGAAGRLRRDFDSRFFSRTWRINGTIRAKGAGRPVFVVDAPRVLQTPRRFRDEARDVRRLGVLVAVPATAVITGDDGRVMNLTELAAGDVLAVTGRFVTPRRRVQTKGGKLIFNYVARRIVVVRRAAAPPGTTPPVPPPSAFPSAANTGVPAGTNLTPSGSLTLTTAGAVVEGLDVRGTVTIRAPNVVFRRSRVTSDDFWPLTVAEGQTGVVIEDVEIDGLGAESGSGAIRGPVTVVRANIHGTADGIIAYSGSTIRDSYIYDLRAPAGAHFDGILVDGASNVTIEHNTVVNPHDQTSAIMISNTFGPVDRVTVSGNRLTGGGYTIYSDAKFSSSPISNVTITGNRFGRGYWGYGLIRGNTVTWQGNVDDATGRAIARP